MLVVARPSYGILIDVQWDALADTNGHITTQLSMYIFPEECTQHFYHSLMNHHYKPLCKYGHKFMKEDARYVWGRVANGGCTTTLSRNVWTVPYRVNMCVCTSEHVLTFQSTHAHNRM